MVSFASSTDEAMGPSVAPAEVTGDAVTEALGPVIGYGKEMQHSFGRTDSGIDVDSPVEYSPFEPILMTTLILGNDLYAAERSPTRLWAHR